jgi:hypothetical protein
MRKEKQDSKKLSQSRQCYLCLLQCCAVLVRQAGFHQGKPDNVLLVRDVPEVQVSGLLSLLRDGVVCFACWDLANQ